MQKNQLYTVTITGYTAEGLGVARVEGQVVFVHGGVRGEVCEIRILKVLKNAAFARTEAILSAAVPVGSRTAPIIPLVEAVISGTYPIRRSFRPNGSE